MFYLGHFLDGRLLSPSLTFGTYDTSVTKITNEHKIFIQSRRGQVYVNDAKIIDGDIMALNGAIHVIDTVLFTDLNKTNPEPNPTPNPVPNPKPNTRIFDSWKFQQIQLRSEIRIKRAISPISKSHGKKCGTKAGPQPRHITELGNEGASVGPNKLAPQGRNSLETGMKNKDLLHAYEKLLG